MNMLLISGCERAVSIHSEHMKRGCEIWCFPYECVKMVM